MKSIVDLAKQVMADYPDIKIQIGQRFEYIPVSKVIKIDCWIMKMKETTELINRNSNLLLHELGHHLTGSDEVTAWKKTMELSVIYNVNFDSKLAGNCLASY